MRIVLMVAVIVAVLSAGGRAHAQQQIPEESLQCLQEVFTGVRDNLLNSVDDYWHRGEYERLIAIHRLLTEIDPTDVEAYDDGAWLMQNQLRDDESEVFLLIGLDRNPDRPEIYESLGYYYYMHERPLESVTCYEKAVAAGAQMLAWNRLAHAYEQAGYFYESANIWRQLSAIEPDNPVPGIQVDRMLSGEPPSDVPAFTTRAREQRKKAAEGKGS